MISPKSPCTYFELSGQEFIEKIGSERPVLCKTWNQVEILSGLRAIESHLLPWTTPEGEHTDVLAWPDGRLMVSGAMFQALIGAGCPQHQEK